MGLGQTLRRGEETFGFMSRRTAGRVVYKENVLEIPFVSGESLRRLRLCRRSAGETLRLGSGAGERKMKRILIDRKIPKLLRELGWMIFSEKMDKIGFIIPPVTIVEELVRRSWLGEDRASYLCFLSRDHRDEETMSKSGYRYVLRVESFS